MFTHSTTTISFFQDDDWFDIYDPRNPMNQRRREKDRVDGKKKEKDRRKQTL